MSQDYRYPNSAVSTVVLSSEGPNGDPAPADSIQVGGKDDSGDLQPLHVDAQGNLQVDVLTSPLPTNAATATNQVLQLAQETAISGKLPATLGQKASAASLAVVIASDQSAVPVSAASLPLPAGASTLSEQQTQTIYLLDIDSNTSDAAVTLASIDSKTPNLSSGRVPVDVQASVLPTGAATDTTLSAINAKVPNLGQAAMVASTPVVIASNQSAVPVSGSVTVSGTVAATQSGAWNITNISGTVSLPTGAATLAEQQTQSASLASIDAGTPATLGQTTMSASMPVTIASNQSALSVSSTPVVPAALTVKQAAITVGGTAVRCTTDAAAPSSTRRVLVVQVDPASTANFWIGSSSVTATSTGRGPQLIAGQIFTANDDAGEYYIISDTASQTVFILEQE